MRYLQARHRSPVVSRALAPSLPAASLEEWDESWKRGANGKDLSPEDAARLRLAQGSNMFALTTEADLQELLSWMARAGQILVVDYYAPWCRACRRLLSGIEKLSMTDKYRAVNFASVDFEQSRSLAKAKGIDKLPTLEIYRGDELQQRWSGASKKRLMERLDEEIAKAAAEEDTIAAQGKENLASEHEAHRC